MTEPMQVGEIVADWYYSALGRDDGAARAARARLRRCRSPVDALTVDETHHLNDLLRKHGRNPSPDQLALLATTFARLKGIHGAGLASVFGRKPTRDAPRPLSELRFQSLIRVRSHRDLMAPLRRALGILGPEPACDGRALATDLYFWNDNARSKWCFQYFGGEIAGTDREETAR